MDGFRFPMKVGRVMSQVVQRPQMHAQKIESVLTEMGEMCQGKRETVVKNYFITTSEPYS